jgi:Ig-like domain-containing protein
MKPKLIIAAVLGTLLFAACAPAAPLAPTPDIALIRTSAAQTVMANFTLTAAAWTATPLPPPTETPVLESTATIEVTAAPTLPGGSPAATQNVLCDQFSWDDATVDVNIPDGAQMQPGQEFVKTWKIKNAGSCTWGAGYKVIYAGYSDQMSGVAQPINGVIGPGQEVQISVQFKAPTKVGQYLSAWTLANPQGFHFFGFNVQGTFKNKPLFVKIVVKL